jgi:hypothetical protein
MVYFGGAMEYIKLSIRIPRDTHRPLAEEASNDLRSINQQIIAILKERYNNHAPPVSTKAKSHNGLSRKEKTKATA